MGKIPSILKTLRHLFTFFFGRQTSQKASPLKNCPYSIARFCYYSTQGGSPYFITDSNCCLCISSHTVPQAASSSLAPIDSLIFAESFEINVTNHQPNSCSYVDGVTRQHLKFFLLLSF